MFSFPYEVGKILYNFTHQEWTSDAATYLARHTESNATRYNTQIKGDYYTTYRNYSEYNPDAWRVNLSHKLVKAVESTCEDLMTLLNYKPTN